MNCPNCRHDNPSGNKFCAECGVKLPIPNICPACRTENPAGTKFCSECGAKLTAAAPVPPPPAPLPQTAPQPAPEQLKTLTVLFSDISGFTAMSEKLNPDEVDEIMKQCFAPLAEAIRKNGGTVIKYVGDAIMAVFGMERALEDDPVRAGRTALAMQAALAATSESLLKDKGFALKMRIGLNTGLVKVTEIGGKADLIGDAVNLASRLEHAAPIGGVLLSYETFKHIRGLFDVKELEPISVKGKSEPIQVYELLSERERGIRVGTRGIAGIEVRMFGRDTELKTLLNAFERTVESRQPGFVAIVGEAGQGKSRMEYEFHHYIEDFPDVVIYNKGGNLPVNPMSLFPFYRIICEKAKIKDDESKASAQQKLEEMVVRAMSDDVTLRKVEVETPDGLAPKPAPSLEMTDALREQIHFIAELIGFEYEDSPFIKGIRGSDPKQIQMRGFFAFQKLFARIAAQQPYVLIFEDIHWADESTLRLIDQLITSIHDVPLLILGLARPELYERHAWFNKSGANRSRVDILPLTQKDRAAFIRHILQRCAETPDELVELIDRRSEGNPFFVEELIRMLIDCKVIVRPDAQALKVSETLRVLPEEKWRLDLNGLHKTVIPTTIDGVIQARIDQLTETQKRVISQSAVVGRMFWKELLAYFEGHEPDPQNPQDPKGFQKPLGFELKLIEETLNSLQGLELVYRRFVSTLEGSDEYIFKHILTREVVYRNTLRKVKLLYHRLAGEWLERKEAAVVEKFSDLIAHHYEHGEMWDKAVEYYQKAGDRAKADYSNDDAHRHYAGALRLMDKCREADRPARELAIRIALDGLYELAGQGEAQAENLIRARAVAEQTGNPTDRADALNHLGGLYWRTRQFDKSSEVLAEARQLAVAAGYRRGEAYSLNVQGNVFSAKRDWQQAIAHFERALAIDREISDRSGEGTRLGSLGIAYYNSGQTEQGLAYTEQALAIAKEIGDKQHEGVWLGSLGIAYTNSDQTEQGRAYTEQALAIAKEIGDKRGEGVWLGSLGIAYTNSDQTEQGRAYTEQALAIAKEIGDKLCEGIWLGNLGYAYLTSGQTEQALVYTEQALAIVKDIGDKRLEGWCLGVLGSVYSNSGQIEKSLVYTEQALAIAKEIGDKQSEGSWLGNLGIAYQRLSQLEKAIEYSEQALIVAKEIGRKQTESETCSNLSVVYYLKDDAEKVQVYCQQSLAVESADSYTAYGKSLALLLTGQTTAALAAYPQARAAHPGKHVIKEHIDSFLTSLRQAPTPPPGLEDVLKLLEA